MQAGWRTAAALAARVLLEGLAQAKEPPAAARAMRGRTFETALGTIRLDEKGDLARSPYVICEVKGGEFVQVAGLEQRTKR